MSSQPRKPRTRKVRVGERQIVAVGQRDELWLDFYHQAMTVSFWGFIAGAAAAFLLNNLFFATLYWLGDNPLANAAPGDFLNQFFFSVETFTTVGYGDMHPQTVYAHAVATFEGFAALFETAALTGLIFARLSRPRARIIFAANPVVSLHDGEPTLMIRLANARHNSISDANAVLWILRTELSVEGQRYRRFHRLALARHENPSFILSWTLFHPINDASPLFGKSIPDLEAENMQLILTVKGLDETSAQELRSRKLYNAGDIEWGRRYSDIISVNDAGLTVINYNKFDKTLPERPQSQIASGGSDMAS